MNTLPLLLLLALPAAAHDHDKMLEYGPISEELPEYRGSAGEMMTKALKKAKPETRKLVTVFARHKSERCGVCDARLDAEGVHCRRAEGLFDNCGHGCGEEFLLVPAAELQKAEPKSGDLRALILYGAFKNGHFRKEFMAPAVATCR